jgi:hypothetical protein
LRIQRFHVEIYRVAYVRAAMRRPPP